MVIQLSTLVLPLVLLIDSTFCSLFVPTIDSTHLQETNGTQLRNGGYQTFAHTVVLYNPSVYSNSGGPKQMGENGTAEETGSKMTKSRKKFQSKISLREGQVFGSVLLLLGTLSILCNSCTFILFYFQDKHLSPVELLIVHLAIVDFISTFASYPLPIAVLFNHEWYLRDLGCKFYAFVNEFLSEASVFSITLIGVFRCLKTCMFSLGIRVTSRTSYKMLALGNVLSFLWAVTPFVGIGKYDVEPFGLECGVNWNIRNAVSQCRVVPEAIFEVFLPLVIVIVCYIQIIKTVIRSTKQLQNTQFGRRNRKIATLQLIFIGTLVVLGFAITKIPIAVVMLLNNFQGGFSIFSIWTTLIPILLEKSSVALHPFVYVLSTKRYRNSLFRLLYKWLNFNSRNQVQYYITFNRSNFSDDMKSIFERDFNENVFVEMYINSSEMHEIQHGQRTFECRNGEGYIV